METANWMGLGVLSDDGRSLDKLTKYYEGAAHR